MRSYRQVGRVRGQRCVAGRQMTAKGGSSAGHPPAGLVELA